MRRITLSAILLAFGLALLPLGMGCGEKTPPPKADGEGKKPAEEGKGTSTKAKEPKTPIAAGDGVLKGKVMFGGTAPEQKILKGIEDYKTGGMQVCLAPEGAENFENRSQTWKIDKDKGLAGVVIFLKAPKSKYFEVSEADKKSTKVVDIDQPHCAFRPHISAVFQDYFDGKKLQKTGETFKVKNDAPFPHNSKVSVNGQDRGSTIPPGGDLPFELPPYGTPYTFHCDIHGFMQAKVWSFDHPYFAVTADDGSFEIKNVPTDVELDIMAWHEDASPNDTFYTGKITLKKGETVDPKIPAVK